MKVNLTPKTFKEISKIPENQRKKIFKGLSSLENDPFSGKHLAGKLSGEYSLKVWPYRIIYEIDKESKTVWVHTVIHRQRAHK